MDSKLSPYVLAAPCLVISATLFFLGTGLAPIWPCTWLAAVPVLWLAPRISTRYAFFVAGAAYALGGLNEWSYSRQVLPTWLVALLMLLGACLFARGIAVPQMLGAKQDLASGAHLPGILGNGRVLDFGHPDSRHLR
jgi:apolipoprotein N-acyltransferase